MRLKWIICKVLQKEAYLCAARSPHVVDIVMMPQGLHNTPDILRAEVQKELDKTTDIQGNTYDAILLGYGLCGNGILGLVPKIQLIVPRAHDCITLLLGSRQVYQQYIDSHRGVYWYSDGWICTSSMPGKERYEAILAEYTQKFGTDNAEYLLQTEQNWMKEYRWAVYIDWNLAEANQQKDYTRHCAEYLKWQYECLPGSPDLLQRLADGLWNDEDFLIIPPAQTIAEDLTNPGLMKTQKI
jgi:hypothetical protein